MYDIAIIGGSLSGLISAIELSNNNKICIIDINQEIGFPTNFPGLVNDVELIKKILATEEIDNLYLNQNKKGWAMRRRGLFSRTHNANNDEEFRESIGSYSGHDGNFIFRVCSGRLQ